MEAYAAAFRDIFDTAARAGAQDALRLAAATVFDDESGAFGGLRLGPSGELPAAEALGMAEREAATLGGHPGERLCDALSRALLFLLFVAGEHLPADVHQALHARAKATVEQVARPDPSPRRCFSGWDRF